MLYLRILSFLARFFYNFSFANKRRFVRDEFFGNNLPSFSQDVLSYKAKIRKEFHEIDGISFVYRLKNADQFLALSVASVIPVAREIILVDNCSTDETRLLISKIVSQYSSIVNIRVFDYRQSVCQQGLGYSDRLRQSPEGSLALFYNFCFEKANTPYVFKMDAHKILLPDCYSSLHKCVKLGQPVLFLRGIDFFGRSISYEPLLYRRELYSYVDGLNFEYLDLGSMTLSERYRYRFNGFGFLHLKNFCL